MSKNTNIQEAENIFNQAIENTNDILYKTMPNPLNETLNKPLNDNITTNVLGKPHNFQHLSKFPSFQDLENNKQKMLMKKIDDTLKKGKIEKWLIEFNELTIKYPHMAKGSNSFIHECEWRDTTIVVKKPNYKKLSCLTNLLKEIEIWSTLRYPGLVQFLGVSFDQSQDEFYIMMEKINGVNLKDFINDRTKSLSSIKKHYICKNIINAVKFLHTCNPPIIYRDLKPENIMIDRHSIIKLTDFGLSRFMPETDKYNLTGETGTIRYMAPEVYLNKHYDLKVDVYSLGLILYFVYTGEIPFREYDNHTIQTYFEKEDLLFSTKPVSNKNIRFIINMCIQKNPSMRWDIHKLFTEFNKINVETNSGCEVS